MNNEQKKPHLAVRIVAGKSTAGIIYESVWLLISLNKGIYTVAKAAAKFGIRWLIKKYKEKQK